MVKLIMQEYKIVEKESTTVIKRTIEQCKAIFWAWTFLSEKAQKETEEILDTEIDEKLQRCFEFYKRNYGVEIESGYGAEKDIEINICNICEKIRSWEE